MKFSLDQMHEKKSIFQRRNGKTVDAITDAIGKLMVTEYETIPIVVPLMDRCHYMKHIFCDLCIYHFNEKPILKRENEWMIAGYSSRIVVYSENQWERIGGYDYNPTNIIPTYDIYE